MTYTEEQLQQIDQFASIYLRPTDIAVILGVRIEEFKQDIQDESNPAFTAYRHGKALSGIYGVPPWESIIKSTAPPTRNDPCQGGLAACVTIGS